jgi:hypothetical protein
VNHALDGAQLKFDWASKNLDLLHDEIRGLVNKDTHGVLDKYDPKHGEYVRYILGEDPPPRWSLLIGDVAHNFRSCLDHIAWQLAIARSPTGKPEDYWENVGQIAFPIFKSRSKYRGQPNRKPAKQPVWRLDGVLQPHGRQMRKCQPYMRRDAPESHPLWLLHGLSNIDKHRVLHTTVVDIDDPIPAAPTLSRKVIDPETGEIEMIYEWPEGLRGGDVAMHVYVTAGGPTEGDVRLEGNVPFQVEIDQPGTVLHEQPVLRLMDGIRDAVANVLAAFRPLL